MLHLLHCFLHLFLLLHPTSSVSVTCKGHDACHNEIWTGSHHITCKNGERLCQNTILKCGREDCSVTIKGSHHDAYTNSIIYAQNIRMGAKFELKCQSTGQRQCKNNIIYCPREVGTTCTCTGCHSSTTMYYKYGTTYSTGGATGKMYLDTPIVCEGKAQCKYHEQYKTYDYLQSVYTSYLQGGSFEYTNIDGVPLQYKHTVGENYSIISYNYNNNNEENKYEIVNFQEKYGSKAKLCKTLDNTFNYYLAYRPTCNKYQYGDPEKGFWVLGEPAQSCSGACIDYNMTCNKKKHLQHLVDINTTRQLNDLLKRFHVQCHSYTTAYLNGKRTPVFNALTYDCILSNISRSGSNWYCDEPPWENGNPSENKRRLCYCTSPISTQQKICTEYINKTNYINKTIYKNQTIYKNKTIYNYKNKTIYNYKNQTIYNYKIRYQNQTIYNYKDKIRYINKTNYTHKIRYINKYIDKIRYLNKIRYIDTIRYTYKKCNETSTKTTLTNVISPYNLFSIAISIIVIICILWMCCCWWLRKPTRKRDDEKKDEEEEEENQNFELHVHQNSSPVRRRIYI